MDDRYDARKRSVLAIVLIILIISISYSFLFKNYGFSVIKGSHHGQHNAHHHTGPSYRQIHQHLAALAVFSTQVVVECLQSVDHYIIQTHQIPPRGFEPATMR
jgi:hypothetical protein